MFHVIQETPVLRAGVTGLGGGVGGGGRATGVTVREPQGLAPALSPKPWVGPWPRLAPHAPPAHQHPDPHGGGPHYGGQRAL